MLKNEKGSMEGLLALLFLTAIAGCLMALGLSIRHEVIFNNWVRACEQRGGYVKNTGAISSSSEWDDCVINKKVYVVPGYESYNKDRPANIPQNQ